MIPVVTPDEMAAVDAAVPVPAATLIERAGAAVAFEARALLGGAYGRRVLVVAGKGNNGADGRVAAGLLSRWGARCDVVDPDRAAAHLSAPTARACDLVIDAAFGTGLRAGWNPPPQPDAPVLAVDLPSGVDAATGFDHGSWRAAATVAFGALKPGLLLHPGAAQAGRVRLAEIGPEIAAGVDAVARAHLLEDADADALAATPPADSHKW
ncbi:MAG TPA: bifunctional ADP-dependent NAD(P)H-hydrate dehydratase/NAD(P)H-hydrate epimerase, partial [Acidimicrobiaceae bacterium]|nr:bifunctional ADP-dependent NAD(P)H-hydrate dehydratase/NAD(P)H-hydrate epimerase [Acidimicrobiaceae bacterium]